MKFSCEQCGTRYSIADEKVERKILKIRCKVCEFIMVVRGSDRSAGAATGLASLTGLVDAPEVEWYIAIDGNQEGPMPLERVRAIISQGRMAEDDLVWNESMDDWQAASQNANLVDLFAKPKSMVGPPPLPAAPKPDSEAASPSLYPQVGASHESTGHVQDHSQDPIPESSVPASVTRAYDSLLSDSEDAIESKSAGTESALLEPVEPVTDSVAGGTAESHERDDSMASLSPAMDEDMAFADTGNAPEIGIPPTASPTDPSAAPLDAGPSPDLFSGGRLWSDVESPEDLDQSSSLSGSSVSNDGDIPEIDAQDLEFRVSISPAAVESVDSKPDETVPSSFEFLSSPEDAVGVSPADIPTAQVPPPADVVRPPETKKKTSAALGIAVAIMIAAVMFSIFWFGTQVTPEEGDGPQVTVKPLPVDTAAEKTPPERQTAIDVVVAGQNQAGQNPAGQNQAGQNQTAQNQAAQNQAGQNQAGQNQAGQNQAGQNQAAQNQAAQNQAAQNQAAQNQAAQNQAGQNQAGQNQAGQNDGELSNKSSARKAVSLKERGAGPTDAADTKVNARASSAKTQTPKTAKTPKKKRAEVKTESRRKMDKPAPKPPSDVAKKRGTDERDRSDRGSRSRGNLAGKVLGLPEMGPSKKRRSVFAGSAGPSSNVGELAQKEAKEEKQTLSDGLSQAEVVKVIAQYKKGLNGCHQRQLKREPLRDNRLMLKFKIRPSGRTGNVSIGKKYDGTVLKSCLDALVRRWRFPQFSGEAIDIEYPLIFTTRF